MIAEVTRGEIENQQKALEDFKNIFKEIQKLQNPVKFKYNEGENPVIFLFGEMGAGKSTLGNALMEIESLR